MRTIYCICKKFNGNFIKILLLSCTLTIQLLTSCGSKKEKNEQISEEPNKQITVIHLLNKYDDSIISFHCVNCGEKDCNCSAQFNLSDSNKLTHIKYQFYKSKSGHLYERTWAQEESKDSNKLVDIEYFNGVISQEVDPYTFEELDGWYAKDKNNVYYYRPVSGGMVIEKIEADVKTFKMLKGHYLYGTDKRHVFKDGEIIDGLNPAQLKIIRNNKGNIIKFISGHTTFITD